jgi:uncharacterized membrane protein
MELIPILSLIILFATISTFILAVGAYVLYKIRERKGQLRKAAAPATIQAELITPAPMVGEQRNTQTASRRTFTDEQYSTKESIVETSAGTSAGPQMRPTFVSSSYGESQYQKDSGKSSTRRKFMRYTNEESSNQQKDENKQEDNLRWR